MTTLAVDVADGETVARPARSSDAKAAIAYLIASDASAISIIENESGCTYRVGTKLDPRAASVHWLPEDKARPVLKAARRGAGKRPDIATAIAALHRAAADLHVTLTEHATAMMRAVEAAKRLDQFMDGLRGTGRLREFNRMFKRRRMEAMLNGRGFMSYAAAEARLRKAPIPLLQGGGNVHTATLFADVFGKAVSQTGQQ
jgi:hypothetical protein